MGNLLRSVIDVDIILSVEKNRHKVEINLKTKGSRVVVVEETHDLLNSLNLAFESLEKKVKKEKEKFREKKRRKGRERKQFSPAPEREEIPRKIIKSGDYSPKPMLLEDALLQFDLENKDILVFRKQGSEKWAVLFRRRDGNYGLIEPE